MHSSLFEWAVPSQKHHLRRVKKLVPGLPRAYADDLLFTAEPFVQLSAIKGKVLRSDSGEAMSNSYALVTSQEDEPKHFYTRTDEKGEYLFEAIPAGDYKGGHLCMVSKKE